MNTIQGTIFDIQRFSTHDGPGIRTTVFLKGCPLSCTWCSNPESQKHNPQLLYFKDLCKNCGKCIDVCKNNAILMGDNGIEYDRNKCTSCGECAKICPHEARTLSGRIVTVDEVVGMVRQDWRYYMQSGGGVTCGGGEPLYQPDFIEALLTELHDKLGYHCCLDSTCFAPKEVLERMLPHLNLILLDIKHMDSKAHQELTGVPNEPILRNARHLGEINFPVLIRVPLIPEFNDTQENAENLGEFLKEIRLPKVDLMPFHTMGLSKTTALGKEYTPFGNRQPASTSPAVERTVSILERYGLQVSVQKIV